MSSRDYGEDDITQGFDTQGRGSTGVADDDAGDSPPPPQETGPSPVPRSPSDDGREVSMGEGTQVVANLETQAVLGAGANDVPSQQSSLQESGPQTQPLLEEARGDGRASHDAGAVPASAPMRSAPSSPGFSPGPSPAPYASSEIGVAERTPGQRFNYATPAGSIQNTPHSRGPRHSSSQTPLSSGVAQLPRGDLGRYSAIRQRGQAPMSPGSLAARTPPATPGWRRGDGQPAVAAATPLSVAQAVPSSHTGYVHSDQVSSEFGQAVIWGTEVNVRECMHNFSRFLKEFRLNDAAGEESEDEEDGGGPEDPARYGPYYLQILREIKESRVFNINIDCRNLLAFPATRDMYTKLVRYPQEIIPIMDLVVHQEYVALFGEESLENRRIQVRTYNLAEHKSMRDLDPKDIAQMVAVRGMIVRTSSIIPDIKVGFFRCTSCRHTEERAVDNGRIEEPRSCNNCGAKNSMEMVHNRCCFGDKQMIKLQEAPESIPDGETPTTVTLYAFDDLVDVARPGDRVEITGIFRAVASRPNPRRRSLHSVYKTYIDVIHFRKTQKGRLSAEDASADQSSDFHTSFNEGDEIGRVVQERKERCEALSRDPDIYAKLVEALAPSIWEMDDVKKGVLLMLFGGVSKQLANKRLRGDINVLLCGDPGTSKSQMLSYVHKIAPRGIYTSGKGSSAVGLTAHVFKDPETKEITLESGALVLSDRGICCIDEFDKMSDETRSILHEAMEQQTVSIAKAGIIATLNARTAILASANPVDSRYNPALSIVENVNLLPTLLSRFDLIYLVLDKPNVESDRRLAKHLVSLFHHEPSVRRETMSAKNLSEYISYAKQHINPTISDEAATALVSGYVEMRRLGGSVTNASKKLITATPRQLESLIRLSEAHARLHFREVVGREDVDEAIRLMNVATQKAATDPRTGTIDMDMISTGVSTAGRLLNDALAAALKEMLRERGLLGKNISFIELLKAAEDHTQQQIDDDQLSEALRLMVDDEVLVYSVASRRYRVADIF